MRTALDHIVVGINDLDHGIDCFEQLTSVRAEFGGVHPGRGTRNALLALGSRCYLEIMAPDPEQASPIWFPQVLGLTEPRIIAWAAHTSYLAALAQTAVSAGFGIDGPHPGARSRPDGKMLSWKLFHLQDNRAGLLPFFIEWGRDSAHPATDAPAGCTLESFQLQSPDGAELARAVQALTLDVRVEVGQEALMIARLTTPRGSIELTS